MSHTMPEPLHGQRRYQVCNECWYNRHGGGGDQPERLFSAVREETPCAICGKDTDSGHYMALYDREVGTTVPVVFLDGPREGDAGVTANMSAQWHDTFGADGVTIRYTTELVGGVLFGRVSEIQREHEVHSDGIIRS